MLIYLTNLHRYLFPNHIYEIIFAYSKFIFVRCLCTLITKELARFGHKNVYIIATFQGTFTLHSCLHQMYTIIKHAVKYVTTTLHSMPITSFIYFINEYEINIYRNGTII